MKSGTPRSAWRSVLAALVMASICLSFLSPADRLPRRLRKAFEALEVYNYFLARDLFCRSIDKHKVPAAYGLSVIYGRQDNPFTELDSAFHYISLAKREMAHLSPKDWDDMAEVGLDSAAIARQVVRVDSLAFLRAVQQGGIDNLEAFIDRHSTPQYLRLALKERNALAFETAERANSSSAYHKFMQNYPDADQFEEAQKRFYDRQYREYTESNGLEGYTRFLEECPESPYREEAEYQVFLLETENANTDAYYSFISRHPDNRFIPEAWRLLYILEVGDYSPKSIAAFSLKYPEYPYFEELKLDFELATTRFYPFRKKEKWGFIDEYGEVRIEAIFDWTESFSEQLTLVGIGDDAFYIDKRGQRLGEKVFEDGLPFNQGFAVVDAEGYQGIINRMGQWLLKPEYDACGEYSEGLFFLERDGLFAYANSSGELCIPFMYESASDFHMQRAIVSKEGAFAFIDREGRPLTEFEYDWLEPFGPDSLARCRIDDSFGLIHHSGKELVSPRYTALGEPGNGLRLAANGDQYGFINQRGDTVINFDYHYQAAALQLSRFENGHATVYQKVRKEVKLAVIDSSGAKKLPAIFNGIGSYQSPFIAVRKQDLWGYADTDVNLRLPYKFDAAGDFQDSLALVSLRGKMDLIDVEGKERFGFRYSEIQRMDSLLIMRDTLATLIHLRGDTLLPELYQRIEHFDTHVLRLEDHRGFQAYYDYRRERLIWRESEEKVKK